MRDHSIKASTRFACGLDNQVHSQELIRESRSDDLDVDDLTEAIRRLLDNSTDPDLLSRRDRGSHVIGASAAVPS